MRRITTAAAGALLAGALLVPCVSCRKADDPPAAKGRVTAGEVKAKASEALRAAQQYTVQEREEYRRQMEVRLAELDRRIEALQGDAGKTGAKLEADLEKRLRKLKKQQKAIHRKLKELETASGDAWADLKVYLDRTAKRIERSISRLGGGEGK